MQIDKMLTISNGHIRCETMTILHVEPYLNNYPFIAVYPKGEYGKFIYILDKQWYKDFTKDEDCDLPKDLIVCLDFAIKHKCNILCLEPNGEEIDELYFYDD